LGRVRCHAHPDRPAGVAADTHFGKETVLAKGQKKSNREIRKPKKEKPKAAAPSKSFLSPPAKKK
jgi:hypothetical protein